MHLHYILDTMSSAEDSALTCMLLLQLLLYNVIHDYHKIICTQLNPEVLMFH